VTYSRGVDADPTWAPDGTRLAFESNRNGNVDIYAVNADGSGTTQLRRSPHDDLDPAWSRTDKIAYTAQGGDGTRELRVMNFDGSGDHQLTSAPNFSENPSWSPDGRWIVFDSDRAEKGNLDVYKMRADGSASCG
jgi:Tol biopolymer transport system component